MSQMTQAEYDAAVSQYQASGGKPIEISTMFAKIIDPETGEQKAGTVINAQVNIGKWNERLYTIAPDGTEVTNWDATVRARIKNAPLLYGAGALGLVWGLSRLVR
jgi:hypothetical protein